MGTGLVSLNRDGRCGGRDDRCDAIRAPGLGLVCDGNHFGTLGSGRGANGACILGAVGGASFVPRAWFGGGVVRPGCRGRRGDGTCDSRLDLPGSGWLAIIRFEWIFVWTWVTASR